MGKRLTELYANNVEATCQHCDSTCHFNNVKMPVSSEVNILAIEFKQMDIYIACVICGEPVRFEVPLWRFEPWR